MKYFIYAVIVWSLFFGKQSSFAQGNGFGIGLIIGEPTGISAKLWTSEYTAFDFGLGWSVRGDRFGRYDGYYSGQNSVHVHADYLWHSFVAINSSERFPLYYGIGGRLHDGAGYNSSLAVRGVFGIAWIPRETPIDVFLELVPTLQLTTSSGFGIDAGIGVRYFF